MVSHFEPVVRKMINPKGSFPYKIFRQDSQVIPGIKHPCSAENPVRLEHYFSDILSNAQSLHRSFTILGQAPITPGESPVQEFTEEGIRGVEICASAQAGAAPERKKSATSTVALLAQNKLWRFIGRGRILGVEERKMNLFLIGKSSPQADAG